VLLALINGASVGYAVSTRFSQKFEISDVRLKATSIDGIRYTSVVLANNGSLSLEQPGFPDLPIKLVNISVPDNSTEIELTVTAVSLAFLPDTVDIYPAQPPAPLNGEAPPAFVKADSGIRSAKGLYPGKAAAIKEIYAEGGHKIIVVALYPLQYDFSSRRLGLYTDISFELSYLPGAPGAIPASRRSGFARSIMLRHSLGKTIAGDIPDESQKNAQAPESESESSMSTLMPSLDGHTVDYVIITSENLASEFQNLAEWKTRRGLFTQVRTTEWIEGNYRGADLQEKIRRFIQDAYRYWGTIFVLLGGDAGVVPVRYVPWEPWPAYVPDLRIPTDIYYSDIADTSSGPDLYSYNYDSNHDGRFGDIYNGDVMDQHSDVFLGRAPVATKAQAENFVAKVIAYETRPPGGYASRFLMMASGKLACNNEAVNLSPLQSEAPWVDSYELYYPVSDTAESLWQGDAALDAAAAMQELNKGYHIVYHFDHGGIYQLGTAPASGGGWLYLSNADQMSNAGKPSIIVTPACAVNAFDYSSFASQLLNNTEGGALAFIGNSRVGWSSQASQCQIFFMNLFGNRNNFLGGNFGFMQDAGNEYTRFSMNLLGDPSLRVWTDEPASFEVTHPSSLNQSDSVLVIVVSGGGASQMFEVCLYKKGDVFAFQEITGSGNASFTIHPSDTGMLYVTVSGKNIRPYLGTCHITPARSSLQPGKNCLKQSYPNPFKSQTAIEYALKTRQQVVISIYNNLGQLVRELVNEIGQEGEHQIKWDGKDQKGHCVSSGAYFYRMETPSFTDTKKIIVLK